MYPYILEAQVARRSEHREDDRKLMKELLAHDYRDLKDMDPEHFENHFVLIAPKLGRQSSAPGNGPVRN
ncbi:hypothetical protein C5167_012168 [Papaver somniferum]|uniref:Uncharacterized protein n=1 Tax=Papaver somniferum TaxID=3469 RepID=A0A4Y7IZX8_PAPSO|nr:hypothetical protein C5167_012168 [Papaver somniferum]